MGTDPEFKAIKSIKAAGDIVCGSGIELIAGPCAITSLEHALKTAGALKKLGVKYFRGSIFKPRTSPTSFQGLGTDGIKVLEAVKQETGMGIVSEILDPAKIDCMGVVDIFQVGARSMQNFELLKALAKAGKPVILKRGMSATVEEWLEAARYLTEGGNPEVILCERGIRTFSDFSRFTLDLNVVPYLRQNTEMPVFVDPSHGTGVRSLVVPMALAAQAAGANGLMIEVDVEPDKAPSDGFQTLDLEEFECLKKMLEQ